MHTRAIGCIGEKLALNYYKNLNYKLINQNWTCHWGEIDLVVFKSILVFVEVKYVRSDFCEPTALLTDHKKQKLMRSIQIYLNRYRYTADWRVDLATVSNGEVQVYENILI